MYEDIIKKYQMNKDMKNRKRYYPENAGNNCSKTKENEYTCPFCNTDPDLGYCTIKVMLCKKR